MSSYLLVAAVVCLSAYALVFITLYCAELFFEKEFSDVFEFLLFIIYVAALSAATILLVVVT